jgi:hypothetical protein
MSAAFRPDGSDALASLFFAFDVVAISVQPFQGSIVPVAVSNKRRQLAQINQAGANDL